MGSSEPEPDPIPPATSSSSPSKEFQPPARGQKATAPEAESHANAQSKSLAEQQSQGADGVTGATAADGAFTAETTGRVPGVSVHDFACPFVAGRTILFHVMLLEGSVFVWVGEKSLGLEDLQVAISTPYASLPCVTTLMGEVDGPGSSMAQKLSKRFSMPVFLSYNFEGAEADVDYFVQKEAIRILKELLTSGGAKGSGT
eukprot:gnl/TRDRNA2_/TRDRNA2_187474_c0_seq1.p1 gnl/TRDRNA2_/TRDRNA2_187474_c0~~gnl/TRDRNA2_/TRDRNA2_187474_c0_seq1.p1  ORF type:complete len:201 (+),score=43.00 gnl/TRDRNA2_/TRDRNA2_187474_c0_seq1:40-642(+)